MQDLTNRLLRMKKHWSKWARRRNISCYRVYDKDIPEYPFIAELYENHMILTEIASETMQARADYTHYKKKAIEIFRQAFEIQPENLHLKTRFKRNEGEQYEKLTEGSAMIVSEGGLKFHIYPDNWLDSGLFLDHRNLRSEVRKISQGKKFLNLFCYTGSFSVYAAAGGARVIHNVDLSARYLEIAEGNMRINQLCSNSDTEFNTFRADAREFVQNAAISFYDIIVCDAPVFSKNRKQERDFDVLRDHPQLIRDCLRILKPDGLLFFSTNFRKFSIRFPGEDDVALVTDITGRTIPEDFRNKWIHKCYEIRHSATGRKTFSNENS